MKPQRLHPAFGAWSLIVVVVSGCSGNGAERLEPPSFVSPPRIVLVTVDGLIAAELSLFGGPRGMPRLEQLASDGTAWDDAWTVCPQTRPAVASYLTGLAPDFHGVLDDLSTPLPQRLPTLASALTDRGYRTAAFVDSSLLSFQSGMLHGFATVDDAPAASGGRITWFPLARPAADGAENFSRWLAGVPAGEPWFAWLHFSGPMLAQVLDDVTNRNEVLDRLDDALGAVVAAMDRHTPREETAIVVAGTMGDLRGGESDLPGAGFSLHERAIHIPVVARLPLGSPARRQGPVWAPDIAVTLAKLGGASLAGAEGLDLRDADVAERPLFAWSRATQDQMGWRPLRAVRVGEWKRIEGPVTQVQRLDGGGLEDSEAAVRLAELLAERGELRPRAVPAESVRPVLVSRGIEPHPAPDEGRDFGTPRSRREVVQEVWRARLRMRSGQVGPAMEAYRKALQLDPDNVTSRIGLAEIQIMQGSPSAERTLVPAVERYPRHPDVLHMYAHAIWPDSWRQAQTLLEALLPFKPSDGDVLYDLACMRSLAGDTTESERLLREAIEAGFRPWEHIESDPDLRNLREAGGSSRVLRDYGR